MASLTDAKAFESRYLGALNENEPIITPVIEPKNEMSMYLYPTLIMLPLVISAILVLVSQAQIAIKIIVVILLIISIIAFNMNLKNIDIATYFTGF
jgi:hypothetical protein